jgi:hypothetical protein
MSNTSAPDPVIALAEQRVQARIDRDFAQADQLRDAISNSGWLVTDTADGYQLTPKPAFEIFPTCADLPQAIHLEHTAVSVVIIVDGWPEDTRTCIDALLAHAPKDARIIALDCGNINGAGGELLHPRIVDLHIADVNPGWSSAVTTLLDIAESDVVVLMDLSTVLTGDAISPLVNAVGDDVVAAAWQGVDVDLEDSWRSLVPAGPGEVDAFLGYCVALNREAARAQPPHPKARFYRNADIEWSMRLRTAGGRIVVPAVDLPVRQDRHRGYHDSDPVYRDRESKRTYDRVLQDFRGRTEILRPR